MILFSVLLFCKTSAAASNNTNSTYYVNAVNGSDFNNGSQSHPWKTINYATGKINGGNTLLISAGNYTLPIIFTSPLAAIVLTLR